KVWTDAPIIEEYKSDSDNDSVSNVQEVKEKLSFAFTDSVKHVKTSRENVKETGTPLKIGKQGRNGHTRKGLGYALTRKACFVCGSFSHLIRDCDFHEKNGKTREMRILPLRPQQVIIGESKEILGTKSSTTIDEPHKALKDKGIVDSGCSRHMTGNKAYLVGYQKFKGCSVAFGGSNGRITGKGKIKAGKLDFEDVYYVKELKHYNLFYVSQMCDKKNKVLFTDTDCLVLSSGFKLPDENQVLLKIPRQHNMYSFNLKNIDPYEDLAFLFAKASIDKSNKWHRRLGHVNFKNLNKLVKENLVRGLPSKIFENDHTCVACQKGKQHKASLENQANKSTGLKEANNSAGTQVNDDQELEKLKTQEKKAHDVAESPRKEATHDSQNAHTNSTNLLNAVSRPISTVGPLRALNDGEPSYLDDPSMPHLEDIYASPNEEIVTDSSYDDEAVQTRSKVNKNSDAHALKVWILVDLPFGKKAIRTKWVYRNKKDERGVIVRNKARLVAQGHRQEEWIDYDEVFALVARIKAMRIFLAFASYMGFIVYQMDVKSAFLYGTINEEVYMTQPFDFVDPKFPNKVYKVVKALYGLHKAPRAWYATMSTFLEKSRYRRGAIVKTLFIKQDKKDIMLVQVYIASTPIETLKPLVKYEKAADVDVHLYRYLKSQPKLGLWYPKVSSFDLEAYFDSDSASANLNRKSTIGGCQFLGRRLILWQCKKQTIVATFTIEAEYVAAVDKFCGFRINY
nr:ribonuclease H-like domain-containing protein [Tanacetum cinerariifolium]